MIDDEINLINRYNAWADGHNILIRSVAIAQMLIETSHCRDILYKEYNNCFGIKYVSQPDASGGVVFETHEYIDGKDTIIDDQFAKYNSIENCFNDYKRILPAITTITSINEYLEYLVTRKYATSPNYISLIKEVISDYNLGCYDKTVVNNDTLDLFITAKIQLTQAQYIYDLALDNITKSVINGDFGNGNDRKRVLGDYYDIIQNNVNRVLGGN